MKLAQHPRWVDDLDSDLHPAARKPAPIWAQELPPGVFDLLEKCVTEIKAAHARLASTSHLARLHHTARKQRDRRILELLQEMDALYQELP